ncbi:MAG: hypothetical protein C0598_13325 [Marinilabiliales bacterium]|nr:MAG: hypothetical protein C0598_13325 [Marinilabiliales bacterium]
MRICQISKIIFSIILLLFFSPSIEAQIVNDNVTYDPNIQTVLLHERGDQLSEPVIVLGSGKQLQLSFDDLGDEAYIFRYTIIHCTSDWETSDLEQIEYLEGYFEDEINDYEFSLNAIPQYIHYELKFPNEEMRLKLSGNYIIKVYLDSPEPENVILTRRFFVVEPLTHIEASIPFYPKKLEYTRYKQQIDLKINTPDLFSAEPEQRVNVSIRQNGRWDNMKSKLKPTSIMLNTLEYNYPDGIVFDGGNEFRNFDIKSFWYQSPQIKQIISDANGYNVILHTDGIRNGKPFETIDDLNGRRYIKARNDQNSNIEGEYALVDFVLYSKKIEGADIYILGQLNDWKMNELSRMHYSPESNRYYGQLFLKQGYYNYNYVVKKKDQTEGDITIIEGDYWDTNNTYYIYVYYRERVPEYDRLVGYLEMNSH